MNDVIHTAIVVEVWQIIAVVFAVSVVPIFVMLGQFVDRESWGRHVVICDREHVEPFIVPPRPRGYEETRSPRR